MVTVELIKLGAEISSIIGVFVTIAGVIIAIWIFSKEMKKQTEISQMNLFADYTKRYQEIEMNLPEDEDLDNEKILEDKDVKRYLKVYFDLCSEEYFQFTKDHNNTRSLGRMERGDASRLSEKSNF